MLTNWLTCQAHVFQASMLTAVRPFHTASRCLVSYFSVKIFTPEIKTDSGLWLQKINQKRSWRVWWPWVGGPWDFRCLDMFLFSLSCLLVVSIEEAHQCSLAHLCLKRAAASDKLSLSLPHQGLHSVSSPHLNFTVNIFSTFTHTLCYVSVCFYSEFEPARNTDASP